jgi:chaperonin cofactor prefoldin
MQSQYNTNLLYKEGRIKLALQAYTLRQFKSLRRAAAAFSVQHQQLSNQLNEIKHRA